MIWRRDATINPANETYAAYLQIQWKFRCWWEVLKTNSITNFNHKKKQQQTDKENSILKRSGSLRRRKRKTSKDPNKWKIPSGTDHLAPQKCHVVLTGELVLTFWFNLENASFAPWVGHDCPYLYCQSQHMQPYSGYNITMIQGITIKKHQKNILKRYKAKLYLSGWCTSYQKFVFLQ